MDERLHKWLLPPLLTLLFVLIMYQYVAPSCPGAACPRRRPAAHRGAPARGAQRPQEEGAAAALPRLVPKFPFARAELCRRVQFDMRGRDVIVFLHIQKTGGTTFGRHLVRNIRLEQPCYCRAGQKKCTCHRPGGDKDTWLFSRFSTGWSCGLHADWTELTSCVPAAMERRACHKNKFYISKITAFIIYTRVKEKSFGNIHFRRGFARLDSLVKGVHRFLKFGNHCSSLSSVRSSTTG
uniref:Heparan-sulfate 6-O-sulfotransferase n=1 Tax=Chelydra serpentina TaxID=8475 RepID=A0A8C3TBL0_CHESE